MTKFRTWISESLGSVAQEQVEVNVYPCYQFGADFTVIPCLLYPLCFALYTCM